MSKRIIIDGLELPENWEYMTLWQKQMFAQDHVYECPRLLTIIAMDSCPVKETGYSRNPYAMNYRPYETKKRKKRRRPY